MAVQGHLEDGFNDSLERDADLQDPRCSEDAARHDVELMPMPGIKRHTANTTLATAFIATCAATWLHGWNSRI
jgi:hypothetical protein